MEKGMLRVRPDDESEEPDEELGGVSHFQVLEAW